MIQPPGIENGAFVVSPDSVWYAWVLLLISASAMTDTGSKSFNCALVSTMETFDDPVNGNYMNYIYYINCVINCIILYSNNYCYYLYLCSYFCLMYYNNCKYYMHYTNYTPFFNCRMVGIGWLSYHVRAYYYYIKYTDYNNCFNSLQAFGTIQICVSVP